MQQADLDFAVACCLAEQWLSQTYRELQRLYEHEPTGCFVLEDNGRPAGIAMATSYGEHGFIGNVIVVAEKRGQGLGRALVDHAVAYLEAEGAHNVLLDAVPGAVSLYRRAGFRPVCQSMRYVGTPPAAQQAGVRAMQPDDLPAVLATDRQVFGADRGWFLREIFAAFPRLCKVAEGDGVPSAYLMARATGPRLQVGPWVAPGSVSAPARMMKALAAESPGRLCSVNCLDNNLPALVVLQELGFAEQPGTPLRMVHGPSARLGNHPACFAAGSAAKG